MTRIVAVIERIYYYYFKCIYLKNKRIFAISYCILRFCIKFLAISKKKSFIAYVFLNLLTEFVYISEFINTGVPKGIKGSFSDSPSKMNVFKQNLSTKP